MSDDDAFPNRTFFCEGASTPLLRLHRSHAGRWTASLSVGSKLLRETSHGVLDEALRDTGHFCRAKAHAIDLELNGSTRLRKRVLELVRQPEAIAELLERSAPGH